MIGWNPTSSAVGDYYVVCRRDEGAPTRGAFFAMKLPGCSAELRFPKGLAKAAEDAIEIASRSRNPIKDGELLLVIRFSKRGKLEGSQVFAANIPKKPVPSVDIVETF